MDVEGGEGIDADGNCTNTAVQVILSANYHKVHVQTVYQKYIESIAGIVSTAKLLMALMFQNSKTLSSQKSKGSDKMQSFAKN